MRTGKKCGMNMRLATVAAALGARAFTASAALAQQPIPSYARADESIAGTISRVDGTTIYVHDQRGFDDRVSLHDGTIINPTGLRLSRGQSVTIHGLSNGGTFEAAEIDTPYHMDYAYAPYPVYGPYGYPYAYGYPYGGPWGGPWGYGPRFGFGFRFR